MFFFQVIKLSALKRGKYVSALTNRANVN